MTRAEYDLVFQAFKNYRLYMTKEQEVLSEKILDDLFYPEFDKLSTDDSEINTGAVSGSSLMSDAMSYIIFALRLSRSG